MPIDWIKDDGSFADDWRQKALPPELHNEPSLADIKNVGTLAKVWIDTKKAMGQMVKLPSDETGKREVLSKHFKDVLDADAATARQRQEQEAAAAKAQAEEDAQKAEEIARGKRQETVKQRIGGVDGKEFDKNLELARRAFRSDTMPQSVKDYLGSVLGVEWGKVSDDQIRQALSQDPMMVDIALSMGKIQQDGRLESGDGGGLDKDKTEQTPMQPDCPELYIGLPSGHPVRTWFERRGWDMSGSTPAKKTA